MHFKWYKHCVIEKPSIKFHVAQNAGRLEKATIFNQVFSKITNLAKFLESNIKYSYTHSIKSEFSG